MDSRQPAASWNDEGTLRCNTLQSLHETCDVDQPAGVAALPDAASVVERLDLETDYPPLHGDDARERAHGRADRTCCEMPDIHLGADRHPARLQRRLDRVG